MISIDKVCYLERKIRYSLKSCCTLKSRCPQYIAKYLSQLIPINTALEISSHGTRSATMCICTHALYMHINGFIVEPVYMCAYQSLQTLLLKCSHPQIIVASNRALKYSLARNNIMVNRPFCVLNFNLSSQLMEAGGKKAHAPVPPKFVQCVGKGVGTGDTVPYQI